MQYFKTIQSFLRDEDGAAAIEYALIAAIIGVGLITVLGTVGTDINAVFTQISTALQGV
jgi:pilus assembly protein Flp/PilA